MRSRISLLALVIVLLSFAVAPVHVAAAQRNGRGHRAGIAKVTKANKPAKAGKNKKSRKAVRMPVSTDALAKNGVTTREDVGLMDLSPAVRCTLEHQAGTGVVDRIVKIVENGRLTYKAEVTRDGNARHFLVSGSGKIVKTEAAKPGKAKNKHQGKKNRHEEQS